MHSTMSTLIFVKNEKNGMKNVGRVNCRLCSEYFCDYVLDNIAQRQNCIAILQVALLQQILPHVISRPKGPLPNSCRQKKSLHF